MNLLIKLELQTPNPNLSKEEIREEALKALQQLLEHQPELITIETSAESLHPKSQTDPEIHAELLSKIHEIPTNEAPEKWKEIIARLDPSEQNLIGICRHCDTWSTLFHRTTGEILQWLKTETGYGYVYLDRVPRLIEQRDLETLTDVSYQVGPISIPIEEDDAIVWAH